MAKQAVFPPGEAREDWKILRALSEAAGKTLRYDTLLQVRERIFREWPHLAQFDVITPAAWGSFGAKGKVAKIDFENPVKNYYLKNPICRASKTMHQCVQDFILKDQLQEAAE
jgi:NADH-quinone oxidoreductase subunit G